MGSALGRGGHRRQSLTTNTDGRADPAAPLRPGLVTCKVSSVPYRRRQPPAPLTVQDKVRLQRTWKALEADPTAIGVIVFTRLFEAHPEVQGAFWSFRQMDIDELKTSQHLRQHSSRVMGFVNKIISRLDSEEQCTILTSELCTRHIDYGAYPHQMRLLGEQFIAVVRSTQEASGFWDDDVQAAWEKLFQWITWMYEQAIADSHQRHQLVASSKTLPGSVPCGFSRSRRLRLSGSTSTDSGP